MVVKKQSTKTAQLYAYSFDRETWQGDFNSREEAMQAAMNDEHNKGCLIVYTGIAKLYTPALKSETVLDILKIEADEIAGIAAAKRLGCCPACESSNVESVMLLCYPPIIDLRCKKCGWRSR